MHGVQGMIYVVTGASLSLLILCISVRLFIWNRLSVGVVAIITTLARKFGLITMAVWLSVAMLVIPLVWPLR